MNKLTGRESIDQLIESCRCGSGVTLTISALITLLERFQAGYVDGRFIQQAANELENDGVVYDVKCEKIIASVLFELSSPEINGMLSKQKCNKLLSMLAIGTKSGQTRLC